MTSTTTTSTTTSTTSSTTTVIEPNNNSNIESQVSAGIDFNLIHTSEPYWPRTISTKALEGRQQSVGSKMEAMLYFKKANYQDCRISAYNDLIREQSDTQIVNPNFLMIDLDLSNFGGSMQALNKAKDQTLQNIYLVCAFRGYHAKKIKFKATVIWSGNGYHIYVVVDSQRLDLATNYKPSTFLPVNLRKVIDNPTKFFLRFMELQLSGGNCDREHNKTVSIKNCMLRVPGSYNSKRRDMAQVRVVQEWDRQSKLPAHLFYNNDRFKEYIRAESIRLKAIEENKEKWGNYTKRLGNYEVTPENTERMKILQEHYEAKEQEFKQRAAGRWGYYARK